MDQTKITILLDPYEKRLLENDQEVTQLIAQGSPEFSNLRPNHRNAEKQPGA